MKNFWWGWQGSFFKIESGSYPKIRSHSQPRFDGKETWSSVQDSSRVSVNVMFREYLSFVVSFFVLLFNHQPKASQEIYFYFFVS